MMTIAIDLTENEKQFIKENNINLVEEIKKLIAEKKEELEDIKKGLKAIEEYKKNPIHYEYDDFWKKVGL